MDAIDKSKIGIIILAAGASRRLGRPKQLLEFEGKTLLGRIIENALATDLKTVVVLGANSERIEESIKNLPAKIVINEKWQSGMSSSIAAGLEKMLGIKENLSAVIILLCDQPSVDKNTICKLIKTQKETNKSIVASEYADTIGVPALFTREIFEELLNPDERNGAKSIIKKYAAKDLATISVPEAELDIDTEEDLKRLKLT